MFSVEVTNDDFDVLNTNLPVLVDFWSPNCGFCKLIAPALEDLAERFLGRVWIAKAQAENNPQAMIALGISKLPTLVMFRDKQEIARTEGNQRWADLKNFIESYVN